MEWTTILVPSLPPFAKSNTTTINVPVTMDDIVEGIEMFNLNIVIPSSESNITLGKQSTAVVQIYDSTG